MQQSTGMFPRSGGYVDLATVLVDGVEKTFKHAAGLTVLAYFSSDAVGSVSVALTGGETITVSAPVGGGKVLTSRNETEVYEVTGATLDASGLTAGSAQISLY